MGIGLRGVQGENDPFGPIHRTVAVGVIVAHALQHLGEMRRKSHHGDGRITAENRPMLRRIARQVRPGFSFERGIVGHQYSPVAIQNGKRPNRAVAGDFPDQGAHDLRVIHLQTPTVADLQRPRNPVPLRQSAIQNYRFLPAGIPDRREGQDGKQDEDRRAEQKAVGVKTAFAHGRIRSPCPLRQVSVLRDLQPLRSAVVRDEDVAPLCRDHQGTLVLRILGDVRGVVEAQRR